MGFDPSRDYPLGTSRPELVRTPGGIALDELELHGERVEAAELRATPETLRMQADLARSSSTTCCTADPHPPAIKEVLGIKEVFGIMTVRHVATGVTPVPTNFLDRRGTGSDAGGREAMLDAANGQP